MITITKLIIALCWAAAGIATFALILLFYPILLLVGGSLILINKNLE